METVVFAHDEVRTVAVHAFDRETVAVFLDFEIGQGLVFQTDKQVHNDLRTRMQKQAQADPNSKSELELMQENDGFARNWKKQNMVKHQDKR